MSDDFTGKVLKFDPTRFKGTRLGDVDTNELISTLALVVQDNIEPRINAAIAPLQAEIEKLRNSLHLVSQQVERVRLGDSEDAGLVLTDDPEERYPFSTVTIASMLPGSPSTNRVATVIDQLGLKGDPQYWCELKVGATIFNRYSSAALRRVTEVFEDPAKHLPSDSPAFRTVMNFLEGV